MKNLNLIGFLVIIWSSYIVWEIQVCKWIGAAEEQVYRADLILILPIIILTTLYVFYKILKK